MSHQPILIAEDDSDDAFLLMRAFGKAGITNPLDLVSDGQKVVNYLEAIPQRKGLLPRLLVLDIKMPLLNGFDVLRWVRSQPGLKRLPVIMLTSSDEEKDINRAYDLGANSYLIKPPNLESLEQLATKLCEYWLAINEQPAYEP
jgi:DNA-binding response OmpR family regulator